MIVKLIFFHLRVCLFKMDFNSSNRMSIDNEPVVISSQFLQKSNLGSSDDSQKTNSPQVNRGSR